MDKNMVSPIKPVYLMNKNGVDTMDKKAIIYGMKTILKKAGAENEI